MVIVEVLSARRASELQAFAVRLSAPHLSTHTNPPGWGGQHSATRPAYSRHRGGVDPIGGGQGVVDGPCYLTSEIPALCQEPFHVPVESVLGCWVGESLPQ